MISRGAIALAKNMPLSTGSAGARAARSVWARGAAGWARGGARAPLSTAAAAAGGKEETVMVEFLSRRDGSRKKVPAVVGQSLLEAAHAHGVDLEGEC